MPAEPALRITALPHISGDPANPQRLVLTPSRRRSRCQRTVPLAASKQKTSPHLLMVKTRLPSTVGVEPGPPSYHWGLSWAA